MFPAEGRRACAKHRGWAHLRNCMEDGWHAAGASHTGSASGKEEAVIEIQLSRTWAPHHTVDPDHGRCSVHICGVSKQAHRQAASCRIGLLWSWLWGFHCCPARKGVPCLYTQWCVDSPVPTVKGYTSILLPPLFWAID